MSGTGGSWTGGAMTADEEHLLAALVARYGNGVLNVAG
jgi:hypothetical protein